MGRPRKIQPAPEVEKDTLEETQSPVKKVDSLGTPKHTFNLLTSGPSMLSSAQESLMRQRARSTANFIPSSLRTVSSVTRDAIDIDHFLLQYLFGRRSIPTATILELIGKEGVGKTTFAFMLAGMFARNNIPSGYIETEGKPMGLEHILRILHPNKDMAQLIANSMGFLETREITTFVKEFESFVHAVRGKGAHKNSGVHLPQLVPVAVFVDTWSKLMSPKKAVGRLPYGAFANPQNVAKNFQELGEGGNLEHAKLMTEWCRTLPAFLDPNHGNNVFLVIMSHQSARIDMAASRGPVIAESVMDTFNKTRIGGRALNQNASFQLIATPVKLAKNSSGQITGREVQIRMDKNSYGPNNRAIKFELRDTFSQDTDTTLESPCRFDEALAELFVNDDVLGTTIERGAYTCKALGLNAVDGPTLSRAFHAAPELMAAVGKHYAIAGYDGSSGVVASVSLPTFSHAADSPPDIVITSEENEQAGDEVNSVTSDGAEAPSIPVG